MGTSGIAARKLAALDEGFKEKEPVRSIRRFRPGRLREGVPIQA